VSKLQRILTAAASICMACSTALALAQTAQGNLPGITVAQLLDRMRETFDRGVTIRSYSIKWEEYSESKSSKTGPGQRRVWSYEEHRTDGRRFYKHQTSWGNSISESDIFIPVDDGRWVSWLWDGRTYFCIRRGSRKYFAELAEKQCKTAEERAQFLARSIGTVDIYHRNMMAGNGTCGFDVYTWTKLYGDSERIDRILRRADKISLRDKTERIGSSECYAIDAQVAGAGKYSLWIDPNHGYLIANAFGAKSPGDTTYGAKGAMLSYSITNVRFSKIGALWVPMEWDVKYEETRAPRYATSSVSHCKRTEVLLNPDFNDSVFEPNVPNGWSVRVEGADKRYAWQDGKAVEASGREVPAGERRERQK
jgi:hypothetical protein